MIHIRGGGGRRSRDGRTRVRRQQIGKIQSRGCCGGGGC